MTEIVALHDVPEFHEQTDVVVCGLGGAGVSVALEARATGAEVVALERFSAGGGSTMLSACEMYLGGSGGTRLQRDLGIEDSSENMVNYLMTCFGEHADRARVEAFVDGAAEHFDWLEAQGIPYRRSLFEGRDVVALTGDSLQFTGNERAWPFDQRATPVPRGHLPEDAGHEGGMVVMNTLLGKLEGAGVNCWYDSRLLGLIQEDNGRICGVVAKVDNAPRYVLARRGVVLTTGGFIMNERMTQQNIPELASICTRHGNPGDQGDGIRLGVAAGGVAIHMGQAFVGVAHYPPAQLTYGLFVNAQGQRFINEDVYLSRLGAAVSQQTDMRAFMFIDNRYFARPDYHQTTEIVAVGETVAEVEEEAGLPPGSLQHTVEYYNRYAAEGVDPLFHKSPTWLAPLIEPPFALVDYSLPLLQPACFTLGGLDTLPTGEVLNAEREPIPGLFAAGRTACGIPRTGAGYASGMSVADATLFGRKAGRQAALQPQR
ncbi:FAD-dependent oxidoreductase [Parahaliea maris]|uniref:FAD-dependent oxidoreductase n=1 Tax=Parahaliea maris TaxID=2716870 RepID=A0A5C9A615_9GAMM|nr:FAD-dependent oxidoreductase [Parahaliea maris]TXS96136.1 FAD-dependent oxidoreductase [Parahaliea maris]